MRSATSPHARRGRAAPAVDVLDSGDPGLEHLERRVERVEIRVDRPRAEPAREPELERMVGRAELERGEPHVVVGVHEPRKHDVVRRAQHVVRRVPVPERLVRPDVLDDAVTLEDRRVFQHLRPIPADGPGHHVAPADQGRRHLAS